MSTETIIVERRGRVGIIRFNRPQALNALNATLKNELLGAVEAFDADANVGCILLTGSDKAFAAGTTRATKPERSASAASIMRPVKIISIAFALPTAWVRRCVPPIPGMMPSLISG